MTKLPPLRPSDVTRVLERGGFSLSHQKGSHAYYRRDGRWVTVPMHPGELAKGTLHAIIRQSGLEPERFAKKGKAA